MKRHLIAIFIVLVLMLLIPRTVSASETGSIYFFSGLTEDGLSPQPYEHKVEFPSTMPVIEKAYILFHNLFLYNDIENGSVLTAIPDGVRINAIHFHDGQLIVDINNNVTDYGGNQREWEIVIQLVFTALSLDEVKTFTVLVDGQLISLPEGRQIYCAERETEWCE